MSGRFHAAKLERSERLQGLLAFMREPGARGRTSQEMAKAGYFNPGTYMCELEKNGHPYDCSLEKVVGQTRIYRYILVEFLPCAPKPVPPSAPSPVEIGYQPEPQEPDVVPGHLVGEVFRFERMPRTEKARYQRVCEGRAEDGSCFCCAWICDGSHLDVFPSYARKAHVLVCCDPELDSNRKYLVTPIEEAADARRPEAAPAA